MRNMEMAAGTWENTVLQTTPVARILRAAGTTGGTNTTHGATGEAQITDARTTGPAHRNSRRLTVTIPSASGPSGAP